MRKIVSLLTVLLLVAVTLAMTSCTENMRAKKFGGTMDINVPAGEEFVNATWKDSDLWIITRDTTTGIYYMHESSNFGIMEGTVIIKP